jgi:protein-L-isoaspartate(D-aspartate) O-methyltransferase
MVARDVGMVAVLAIGLIATMDSEQSVPSDFSTARARMVASQLQARGVKHPRVLEAMRAVPRDRFVPVDRQAEAYDDAPLPIGYGQTISQPYIVAFMTEALDPKPEDRVLEIGTGSGYQAAVLSQLVRDVFTIEIVEPLATRATSVLSDLGYRNVHVRQGNGYLGWPDAAPFSKIIVTAAPEVVPQALVDQLAIGGLMVVPVGRQDANAQDLRLIRKTVTGVVFESLLPVRFVPMVDAPAR